MGKGGAGKGGRQAINGPRQIGTVIEWKGTFGFIHPAKPISHPKLRNGKVYLAAEDVVEELDGVGADVSFQLYSDNRNGVGAADVKMASSAAKAAARNSNVKTGGKVGATSSKGKGKVGKVGATVSNAGASFSKGKGNVGKVAATVSKVGATFGKGKAGKVGATFGKGNNTATTFVKVSKFGHKVVSSTTTSTAAKFGKFAAKAGAAKTVPPTWSKGAKGNGKSAVKQTAFQKPGKGQFQKGGFNKGNGKGTADKGKGAKGAGKGGKQQRDIIYDKPLIGTVTQWRGKFGWVKPKDTIDHPKAKKHQGDLFLSQEDVEQEISGVGARVKFMLYEDSHGLGAANVKAA